MPLVNLATLPSRFVHLSLSFPLLSSALTDSRTHTQAGDFAGSVAHYTESIKRNPEDARGYTNRAAALTKLLALPEALKDAEKAIEVQPDFGQSFVLSSSRRHRWGVVLYERASANEDLVTVKGYIRKSHVLFAMKEYSKALSAIERVRPPPSYLPYQPLLTNHPSLQAATKDTEQKHTSEIISQIRKVNAADSADRAGESDEQTYARAMRDPEVQQIMGDPVFQSILQQAQNEPASLQQHMQNPEIRAKIEKLVKAVSFLCLRRHRRRLELQFNGGGGCGRTR
jgi:stress-induced-phosphoprotein 1